MVKKQQQKQQFNGGDIISSNCRTAAVISAELYGALRWIGREINLFRVIEKNLP